MVDLITHGSGKRGTCMEQYIAQYGDEIRRKSATALDFQLRGELMDQLCVRKYGAEE